MNRRREFISLLAGAIARSGAGALLLSGDALFLNNRLQIVEMVARIGVPAIYANREVTQAGGLMSYNTDLADAYRLAGTYVGRILKGEKPADLPVQQSTKFELVINPKTAKALGSTIAETPARPGHVRYRG